LENLLGQAVAHERRRRGAPRRDAHPDADQRAAQRRRPVARQLLPGLPHDLGVDAGRLAGEAQALFHRQQDLADAEQADHRDQEVEAAHQLGEAEGHAQLTRDRVHADRSQREAERHRHQDLERRALAHADEAAEREQVDRKELRCAELEGELGHQRRQEGDHQHRDEGTDEGRGEGRRQRLAGLCPSAPAGSRRRWWPPTRARRGC
jgi:hypothetical protein